MEVQLKLSQFVSLVAKGIQTLFGEQEFLIIAEVSKVKQRNTRLYIELVEYEANQVIACSHALITNPSVLFNPLKEWKLTLEELKGQQLLMTCTVVFHKDHGYQLCIHYISSEYTLWSLKRKTENVKQQLLDLGIYTLNKQKVLDIPPYRLAIISGESSEGLKDFLYVLDESGYKYEYTLYPTSIHGNTANAAVYKTLQQIYKSIDSKKSEDSLYDMVLIVRGGGWASGIMRHNDFNIAKGICYMSVPVMIAVGHTSDQSILDDIAYASAKTPTDAAYQIVAKYDVINEQITSRYEEIQTGKNEKIKNCIQEIEQLKKDIDNLIQQKLQLYTNNIQARHDYVSSSSPEKMLQSGYALLSSKEAKLLTKNDIANLKVWDTFVVSVYDKKIQVQIVEQ